MVRSKSNIFITFGTISGVIPIFSKILNKECILKISSDVFTDKSLIKNRLKEFPFSTLSPAWIGNIIDINLADYIVCQNKFQQENLLKNFNKKSNKFSFSLHFQQEQTSEKKIPPIVLWVGTITPVKHPELFLLLAQNFPDGRFQIIGGISEDNPRYSLKIIEEIKNITNVEYLGPISHFDIGVYYDKASILVNTSLFEGFPNTFLEAWHSKVPVVSLNSNPDGIITQFNLGFHSKSFTQMIIDVKKLLENNQLRSEMGENAIQYMKKYRTWEEYIDQWINILTQIE
jgi:glycosyltransferase involved in cell wall biosynthesis